jgi:hypothetical protein
LAAAVWCGGTPASTGQIVVNQWSNSGQLVVKVVKRRYGCMVWRYVGFNWSNSGQKGQLVVKVVKRRLGSMVRWCACFKQWSNSGQTVVNHCGQIVVKRRYGCGGTLPQRSDTGQTLVKRNGQNNTGQTLVKRIDEFPLAPPAPSFPGTPSLRVGGRINR